MAHLGTYTIGGITYDSHTGRAIAGTDTVDTEFVDEYNSTYQEVNLTPYSQLQDNDNAFGDQQASLFTNANGDATLTFDAANSDTATGFPPFYDFEKGEFTNIGAGFYTKQMGNSSQEEKDAYLTQVENELKSALIADYNKRKLSNPNAKPNPLLNLNSTVSEETVEPNPNTDEGSTNYLEYGFGKVDKIIKKLSLRNLTYPLDADFGNTQDYIQINQFSYKSPQEGIFFPKAKGKKGEKGYKTAQQVGFENTLGIVGGGVPSGTPRQKAIGLVKLPMPNSLVDSNNVSWGTDKLNALTAAVASGVMGKSGEAVTAVTDFLKGMGGRNFGQNLTEATRALTSGVGGAFNDVKGEGSEMVKQVLESGSNLNVLGKKQKFNLL